MKTGQGLAEYAIAQLGRPYWWGCFGQLADGVLYAQKKKQYPGYYTATDFSSQYGQKVHDCVGLIKGYLWCDSPDGYPQYNGAQDVAVEGLYRKCSRKGSITTLPETLLGTVITPFQSITASVSNGVAGFFGQLTGRGELQAQLKALQEENNATTAKHTGSITLLYIFMFFILSYCLRFRTVHSS